MSDSQTSKFWLDQAADEIIQRYPEGDITISSGHSPSGTYHIGTTREMMTASALTWAVNQRQQRARHIDFVDDFDILRKIPAGLPEGVQSELGKPLYLANSPEPGVTYGEYFYRDLAAAAKTADFLANETFFASTTYAKEHRYTEAITLSLQKLETARSIIETVSHRTLPPDWVPVQLLSNNQCLNEWQYIGHNLEAQTIQYRAPDGQEGEMSYAEGRVKLDWRLDWPARWWMWGVNVEPFGRDHATKGGSYDTGKQLVEQIFAGQAPMPVPYEFIMTAGETTKMSKSTGGVITPNEVLQVMPPEALRYMIVRSRPNKQLFFDPGIGLYNLIDEFANVGADEHHTFRDAYTFAAAGNTAQVLSTVSFKHLVQVYQAAQGDPEQTLAILARTDYADQVANERDVILAELTFVKNWLETYAPDEVKFKVQTELPQAELSDAQRSFLTILAAAIEEHSEIDGQRMHELIYAAKEQADVPPRDAFQALYRVILGKDSGPKAGWFLSSLDHDWLIKRLHLQA